MQWVSERDLAADGRVRLFCLPHAGSGAAGFYAWKRLLPATIAVCPVLLPGREGRLRELCSLSVGEIVSALQQEVGPRLGERPYAIFGHSMGTLLAFEWARAIAAEGLPGPVALIACGRNAPDVPLAHAALHGLPEDELIRALEVRYGGNAAGLLDDPELRALFLPIVRADLRVVETYRFVYGAGLSCPVAALAGVTDTSVSEDGLAGWRRVTSGVFQARRLAGDHFFPHGDGRMELMRMLTGLVGVGSEGPGSKRDGWNDG